MANRTRRSTVKKQAPKKSGIEAKIIPVDEVSEALSALFYGRSGTGKTTLACSFPGPIILLDIREKGTDSVTDRPVHVLPIEEWDDLDDIILYLRTNPSKFKTVVVDTVTNMQSLAMDEIVGDSDKVVSQRDWGKISGLMRKGITELRDLTDMGMEVIFLAQEKTKSSDDYDDDADDGQQIMPEIGPMVMPSVAGTLNAAVKVIGNTFIREEITRVKVEGGGNKRKANIEYALRLGPHAYYTTKIRKNKGVKVPSFITDPSYDKVLKVTRGEGLSDGEAVKPKTSRRSSTSTRRRSK